MVSLVKTLGVEPGGQLDDLLSNASGQPVTLTRGRERYRVESMHTGTGDDETTRADDASTDGGPERERADVREAAGRWNDVDAEQVIADIYRSRQDEIKPSDS